MGIIGFEWYVEKIVPNGTKNVNMIDEILKWKEKYPNQDPIIIIDLSWLIFYINQGKFYESVCGGRNNFLLKEIETFLERLCTSGAKLVVFERAYVKQSSDMYWNLDDCGIYTTDPDKIVKNYKVKSSLECKTLLGMDIESIGKKFGEVKFSYIQRSIEVLRFIQENDSVLAIFAKDSNFLMYDLGDTQYWTCDSAMFNTSSFNTKSFAVQELNEFLQFSQNQKALFGSLARFHHEKFKNNFNQPFFAYQNFANCNYYKALDSREKSQSRKASDSFRRIKMIATYVFTRFPDNALDDEPDFSKIAKDVFDIEEDEEAERILKKRYDRYKEIKIDDEDGEYELYRKSAEPYQFIYNILINKAICLPPEDFAMVDLNPWNESGKTYVDLILPIYKRIMGVLFQHKGDETITCKIVASFYHVNLFPNKNVLAEYPIAEVPDLDVLIFYSDHNDNDLNKTKWCLLYWILAFNNDKPEYQHFQAIEDDLKPVLLALIFLRQEQQISVNEADTILITEIDVLKERSNNATVAPKEPNGRAVRVAQLYVQMRNILNRCFRACGLLKYAHSSKFDGVHFHQLLDKYQNGSLYKLALNRIKEHRLYA